LGGGEYLFTAKYVVKACEDFTNVKTQGGLVAGAYGMTYDPAPSNVKSTKQNTIINWINDFAEGETKVYTVTYKLKLKKSCTEYPVTGAWSAKGKDVDNLEVVAGYDNILKYQTPCPE
jgi:hypothetical protein